MNSFIFFRISCETQFNQNVKVVGSIPQLGDWNPKIGFQLVTNESTYPIWFSDYPLQLLANQNIEFKVVISEGQQYYWECCPNREMYISSFKQFVIANYDNPFFQIFKIKTQTQEADMTTIELSNTRKVSIQIQDYLSYTDSDSEGQNSQNFQMTDDLSLFSSNESFNSCKSIQDDVHYSQTEMN